MSSNETTVTPSGAATAPDPRVRADDLHRPRSELAQELTARRQRLAAAGGAAVPGHDLLGPGAALYDNLVQHGLGLIYSHDLEGTILSINGAAASMLDFQPAELLGVGLTDLIAPDFRSFFPDYLQRIRDNRADQGMMRLLTRHGEEREWTYRNVLMTGPDGTAYVLGHAHDLTALLQARRDLRRVRNELEVCAARHETELARSRLQVRREVERRHVVERELAFVSRRSQELAQLASGVLEHADAGRLMRRTVEGTARCFEGAQAAYLKERRLALVASYVSPRRSAAWHLERSGSIAWPEAFVERLRVGPPLAVGDAVVEPAAAGGEPVSVLATSLRPRGDFAGILCVQAPGPREWLEYEVDAVREIASLASTALARSGDAEEGD